MRGSHTIPSYLKSIYITPNDPYDPVQRALRTRLVKLNVLIVCDPKNTSSTLKISKTDTSENALANGPSGQVQRYKYNVSINYSLSANDVNMTRSITRSRELSRSNNLLYSNESEKHIIKQELVEEVVNELLRQITSRPPYNSTQHDSSTIDSSPC